MGNSQQKPTRRNKEQIVEAKQNRSNATAARKQQIVDLQTQFATQTIDRIKNTADTDTCLTIMEQSNQANQLIEKSKTQLDREGMTLTKNDLIAIIVALDAAKYAGKINELNSYTIPDLNTIIRIVIYDPSRYMNSNTTASTNTTSTNNLPIKPIKNQPAILPVKSSRFMLLGF